MNDHLLSGYRRELSLDQFGCGDRSHTYDASLWDDELLGGGNRSLQLISGLIEFQRHSEEHRIVPKRENNHRNQS